jgi:DnaD/phage-associated family protein
MMPGRVLKKTEVSIMPVCSFTDNYMMYDATPVENLFIQEYMTRAPGEFVRVYLYGLMMCYHPGTDGGLQRIAKALNMEQDAVSSAYRYWEREGAVIRISDKPPAYQYINLKASMLTGQNEDPGVYKHREFNAKLQALFSKGRVIHPYETQRIYEWIEDLKLPEEVVLALIKSKLGRGEGFSFRALEKIALSWAEQGISTPEEADEILARDSKAYQAAQLVIRQFNQRRAPTKDETDCAKKWLEEWGLTAEAIIAACKELNKGERPSFGYLDSVLKGKINVKTDAHMSERIAGENALRDAVKEIGKALGIRAYAPSSGDFTAYNHYLAAGFDHESIVVAAEYIAQRGPRNMKALNDIMTRFVENRVYTHGEIVDYLTKTDSQNPKAQTRDTPWALKYMQREFNEDDYVYVDLDTPIGEGKS